MFYIQQESEHDCLFTCIKILLANLNKDNNYLYLSSPFNLKENVSLLKGKEEAKKYRLTLGAYKVEDKDNLSKDDKLPFIAVTNEGNSKHAILVYKVSKTNVYCLDPAKGKRKIKYDIFTELWTGEMLAYEDHDEYECPIKKIDLLKPNEKVLCFLFPLISVLFCLGGLYFIKKDSYFIIPLTLLVFMIISEILQKKFMIHIASLLDERINEEFNDIKGHDYYGFHYVFENYKKYLLINNVSFYSSAFISLLLIALLIINGKSNIVLVVFNIFLAVLSTLVIMPKLNKKIDKISKNEESLKFMKNKSDAFNTIDEVRNESYTYGTIVTTLKYTVYALDFILVFMMMLMNKICNVPYIICYFCMEIYLYQNLCNLLSIKEDKKKQDNLLVKLNKA